MQGEERIAASSDRITGTEEGQSCSSERFVETQNLATIPPLRPDKHRRASGRDDSFALFAAAKRKMFVIGLIV